VSYNTTWPDAPEDPVVDDGNWAGGAQVGVVWGDCKSVSGSPNKLQASAFIAADSDDAIAIRTDDFNAVQSVKAVAFRDAGYAPSFTHEFVMCLRCTLVANNCTMYELNYGVQSDLYQLARWNGTFGDVTVLTKLIDPGTFVLADQDEIELSITSGHLISLKANTVLIDQWDGTEGTTLTSGKPGLGFFIRPGAGQDVARACWQTVTVDGQSAPEVQVRPIRVVSSPLRW